MSLDDFINKRGSILSKKKDDDSFIIELDPDVLIKEYEEGVSIADPCRIPRLSKHFSWKRGFQNCWTGYANAGKSTFALYVALQKSLIDGWKWVWWSPEMRSAHFVNKKVRINYNDLHNEIIWMITGKTPYKHIAEKYGCERVGLEEYLSYFDWIQEHFTFLEFKPDDRDAKTVYKSLLELYDKNGFDGIFLDPFKNIKQDPTLRTDIFLEQLFADYQDLAIRTNSVMNWIAHPKANVQRTRQVGNNLVLLPCDQYMLSGGAAWDNSMDGIYSIFRPNVLDDPNDPIVNFINLKQRKQALTTMKGTVNGIEFDFKRNQYKFEDIRIHMNPINNDDEPF